MSFYHLYSFVTSTFSGCREQVAALSQERKI
jgi:hypothetical protein